MKIIKKGKIPDTTKRFTCSNCGCIFVCNKNEYVRHFDQREGDYCEAKCPTCRTTVYADDKQMDHRCETCRYSDAMGDEEPCVNCGLDNDKWDNV